MKTRRKPGYQALEITLESQLEEDYLIDLVEAGVEKLSREERAHRPVRAIDFGCKFLKDLGRGE